MKFDFSVGFDSGPHFYILRWYTPQRTTRSLNLRGRVKCLGVVDDARWMSPSPNITTCKDISEFIKTRIGMQSSDRQIPTEQRQDPNALNLGSWMFKDTADGTWPNGCLSAPAAEPLCDTSLYVCPLLFNISVQTEQFNFITLVFSVLIKDKQRMQFGGRFKW